MLFFKEKNEERFIEQGSFQHYSIPRPYLHIYEVFWALIDVDSHTRKLNQPKRKWIEREGKKLEITFAVFDCFFLYYVCITLQMILFWAL